MQYPNLKTIARHCSGIVFAAGITLLPAIASGGTSSQEEEAARESVFRKNYARFEKSMEAGLDSLQARMNQAKKKARSGKSHLEKEWDLLAADIKEVRNSLSSRYKDLKEEAGPKWEKTKKELHSRLEKLEERAEKLFE